MRHYAIHVKVLDVEPFLGGFVPHLDPIGATLRLSFMNNVGKKVILVDLP